MVRPQAQDKETESVPQSGSLSFRLIMREKSSFRRRLAGLDRGMSTKLVDMWGQRMSASWLRAEWSSARAVRRRRSVVLVVAVLMRSRHVLKDDRKRKKSSWLGIRSLTQMLRRAG